MSTANSTAQSISYKFDTVSIPNPPGGYVPEQNRSAKNRSKKKPKTFYIPSGPEPLAAPPANSEEARRNNTPVVIKKPVITNTPSAHHDIFMIRSWLSVFPSIIVFLVLAFGCIALSQQFPITVYSFDILVFEWPLTVSVPSLTIFVALALVRVVHLMYDTYGELRAHHIFMSQGILSFDKEDMEIAYEDLLGVHVKQDLIERILGVGNIIIGTAMTDRPEVTIPGLYRPKRYAKAISRRIENRRSELKLDSSKGLFRPALGGPQRVEAIRSSQRRARR